MLSFISFGSGSSGNCYYLYTETEGLLIDVGVGTRSLKKQFHDYGLRMQGGFQAILVTHDHADHIKSVGSLCKKYEIPVYATSPVHSGMDKNYCMRCKISHTQREYVYPGRMFHVGSFNIMPFHVPHDSSDNCGYMIEHDGIVFSILTDVGSITDEIPSIIQQSNYLVIEANYDPQMLESGPYPQYLKNRIRSGTGHLSNVQCAEVLAANYSETLRRVWLCHLSEENNRPEIAGDCVEHVLRNCGIDLDNDLQLSVLRRKLPTGPFLLE